MRDITSDMMSYLEAKRHLWNMHFREKVDWIADIGPHDDYMEIDRFLFLGLVLRDLDVTSYPKDLAFGISPIKEVIIRPERDRPEIPIMLEEGTERAGGVWEKEELFSSSGLELEFIEFFEWSEREFVSYPLVKGRIVKFDDHKEYIGRRALIENMYVRFMTRSKK